MTHVTCRLTAKNRDQLRNPTLGTRVWAAFTFVRQLTRFRVSLVGVSVCTVCMVHGVCSLQVHLLMCSAHCVDSVHTAALHVINLLTTLLRDEAVCLSVCLSLTSRPTQPLYCAAKTLVLNYSFRPKLTPDLKCAFQTQSSD